MSEDFKITPVLFDTKEIIWLAGLLEGEGYFGCPRKSPRIKLGMTDKDVVERVARIMGEKEPKSRQPRGKSVYKKRWEIEVSGTKAISWMMTIYELMGRRRKGTIHSIIRSWASNPHFPRTPRGEPRLALCHPNRTRVARGLCRTCYYRRHRKKMETLPVGTLV